MADFVVSPPGPGVGLQVTAAGGYTSTPGVTSWLAYVNAFAARLAALGADGNDPAAQQIGQERDHAITRLQVSIQKVADTALSARDDAASEAVLDAIWDEAVLAERLAPAPLGQEPFVVTAVKASTSGQLTDLRIAVRDGPIPAEKQQFKMQLDQVLTVIRTVLSNADEEPLVPQGGTRYARLRAAWRLLDGVEPVDRAGARLDEYLRALLAIAKIRLMSKDPTQTPFVTLHLTSFKEEFVVREAGKIKNRYVRRLGLRAVTALAAAALLFIGTKLLIPDTWILFRFRNFLLLAGGAAVGTWLSFAIRRQVLSFADLDTLEEDRLNPALRILFMIALTTVVGLILWTGMVVIEVGQFRSDFTMNGSYAVLIGALCGIAERSLSGAVGQRAAQFAAGVGGNPKTET